MWTGWINAVIGAWLIVSSFIPSLRVSANLIPSGIVIAIIGFLSAPNWEGIANGVIGIWLFLAGIAFIVLAQWNFLIFGIICLVLGVLNATTPSTKYHPRTTSPHVT